MTASILAPRRLTIAGAALLVAGASLVAVAAVASRASASGPTLTVSPHAHLKAGESVVVRGSGFLRQSNGAVFECNDAAGQPATVSQIHGQAHAIPVGCTEPVGLTTTKRGKVGSKTIVVEAGPLGSWESGPDSSGNPAAADSASYPCPPTSAQIVLGVSCVVEFLDNKDQVATHSITFTGQGPGSTTTILSTTTAPPTTTTIPTTTTTSTGSLCTEPVTVTTAGASLTMDPGACITAGTVVTLTGSGYSHDSPGTFLECNSDPTQPTVSYLGNPLPVSCTNPLSRSQGPGVVTTSVGGTLGPDDYTVDEGTIGPPCAPTSCTGEAATDSSGGDPYVDAAAYPCPPTPAEVAAGDVCTISFGDSAGDAVAVPLTFATSAAARKAGR